MSKGQAHKPFRFNSSRKQCKI